MNLGKLFERRERLELHQDVAERLDVYAEALARDFNFPVTRQQAFERFARLMLPTKNGGTHA